MVLYIDLVLNRKINKEEAIKIVDVIEGGTMFFITLDHIFEQENKKGELKGKEEGKIEGEKQKSIEIVKKMLKKGSSVEDVAEMTELSIDEIE